MTTTKRAIAAASLTAALLALTACGHSDEKPATKSAPTANASAPASPSVASTSTASTSPVTGDSDGSLEAAFGADYIGKNGQIITDQMAALAGDALTNPEVARGRQSLASAVGSLPLIGEAASYAADHPETLGMPKIVTDTRTPVAPYVEAVDANQMAVHNTLATYNGQKVAKATFTGHGRLFYTEAGKRMSLDYSRDYVVYLTPSTDTKGDRWDIVAYHGSPIAYGKPQAAQE